MKKSHVKTGERARFRIELEMEKLRFYQIFFLPTGSGVAALLFTYDSLDAGVLLLLSIVGISFMFFLYMLRSRIIRRINELIENT